MLEPVQHPKIGTKISTKIAAITLSRKSVHAAIILQYSSLWLCLQSVIIRDQMDITTHTNSEVRYLEIDHAHTGQRLDNYLFTLLKGVPKSHVYRIVRSGEIRINSGRCQPNYRLKGGDRLRIPPLRMRQPALEVPRLSATLLSLEDHILFEDHSMLILNKPSGVAVHSGSGVNAGVIEALRIIRAGEKFIELAHRLDRDTSGCLVLAKSRPALIALQSQWRVSSGVVKRYSALVKGRFSGGQRHVSMALRRNVLRSGERLVNPSESGRQSESVFTSIKNFRNNSLVGIELLTGRTHQARVHAAQIGHPIAGDSKYGNREFNHECRRLGLKRLFLHASKLTFCHPLTLRRFEIEAPLPDSLNNFLDKLAD